MRVFGGSIGVATSFFVLNTKIQRNLQSTLTAQQLQDVYRSPLAMLSFSPLQLLEARQTFIDAFQIDMYICVGVSSACLVASLCTYQRRPPSVKTRLADVEAELERGTIMSAAVPIEMARP